MYKVYPISEKPNHFKNMMARAETPEEKREVMELLGSACCCAMYEYLNDENKHPKVPEFLRKLDKVARSIVIVSAGIQPEYKLSDFWLHTMFAQIALEGGRRNGNEDKAVEMVKELFARVNWNYEDSIAPMYDDVTTLMTIEYFWKYSDTDEITQTGTMKIILFPATDKPVGSVWKSTAGKLYRLIAKNEKGFVFEPEEANAKGAYTPVELTEYQISRWSKL